MSKNSNTFSHRFLDKDYIPAVGIFEERRLFGVNHICLHSDCTVFNDILIPFGAKEIEKNGSAVIDEILNEIVHALNKNENINKKIIICGEGTSRRMLGRKLEDRIKRGVIYE